MIQSCSEKLGSQHKNAFISGVREIITNTLKQFASTNRTAALWVQYHNQVQLVKDFIRAERLSNFDDHLSSVTEMLPTFAAAGHSQYAKGARLYIELMDIKLPTGSKFGELFRVQKLHTVRYNKCLWAGVWTDIAIEQTLMKSIKSRGGLVGGRLRNQSSAHKSWVTLLDHFSDVSRTMDGVDGIKKKGSGHPDTKPAAVKKNKISFMQAKEWFKDRVDFDQETEVLMSFSTGLYSVGDELTDKINCDNVQHFGSMMQEKLDGKNFTEVMETKDKVKNLSLLRKPVKVTDKTIVVESLKLFNRLILITERSGNLNDALKYELTPFPMSLFDEKQCMRQAKKADLGKYLKNMSSASNVNSHTFSAYSVVIDGGWLLHQCPFQSSETFGSICLKYAGLVKTLAKTQNTTVVFDGYNSSPKDHEHKRRIKNYSANILLNKETPCTMSKQRFLSNNQNKSQLIVLLSNVLSSQGIHVVVAADDADTLVVREALKLAQSGLVHVHADDTDILCMLTYHITTVTNDIIFLAKSGSYSSKAIHDSLPSNELRLLLLAHAFSGCDTTSRICGFGKVRILKKLANNAAPSCAIDILLNTNSNKEDVVEAGTLIFQYIYGRPSTPLYQIRFDMYNKSMAKGKLLPQKLAPTEGAAAQHTLRVFLQWRDWNNLQSQSLNPADYGWSRSSGTFEPVGYLEEIAPQSILNFTICNCKTTQNELACRNDLCSCKRIGLKCLPACGNCHGMNCSNAGSQEAENVDSFSEDESEFVENDSENE